MYEETDVETVVYTCSVCGKSHAVTSDSMREIAESFENMGWGNHRVDRGYRVEYVVLCKEHNTADRVALLAEYAE